MTSLPGSDILDHGEVLVSPSTDIEHLVRGLSEHDQTRKKAECGIAWFFQHQPGEDAPTLTLGVRGTTGALMWFDAATCAEELFNPLE
ncbi:hypothetical protein [Saccharopolyspora pogona]|uniref:hypothetical protein n=1 Tax=Saccharopolyspora pogona TaxID=333966 RepID=UPI001687301C|nr:hypothetical protein [Saccharopolyspora pogona]